MHPANESKILTDNIFLKFLTDTKFRIYRHLLLILFIGFTVYYTKEPNNEQGAAYLKMLGLIMLLSLFYINMYWLMPKFLLNNRYQSYILGIVACTIIFYSIGILVRNFFDTYVPIAGKKFHDSPPVLFFIFIIIVLIGASTAVKLFQRWIIDTKRINELENITIQAELEQLKNQINPHFLFNMLNNVNVLTHRDPDKASQVLMKLSDLLRYQLYDSTREKVLLTSDIHFLEDFLNLEKIRRDNFDCMVVKEGELSGVQIAPLLFITFAENAVKHNLNADNKSYVYLFFKVQNNELSFKCINSKPQIAAEFRANGGLGLVNVKRRLEILYTGRYDLIINNDKEIFTVNLTIKL